MFILYFDENYFKWAPMLIESIGVNEPEECICVYGIELTEFQVERLHSYSYVTYVPSTFQKTVFVGSKKRIDARAARIVQKTAGFFLESFYRFPQEKLYMILEIAHY